MKIVGQKSILRYLRQGLTNARLSPSLLFIGSEGVGKKTVALELAHALLCTDIPGSPTEDDGIPHCGRCENCEKVSANNHPDLFLLNG